MAPSSKENRSTKSQLRRIWKKVSKQRAELSCTKESLEKYKAKAEEKAIKLAERRSLNEVHKKKIAFSERFIDLNLDIFAAEHEGDFARVELLKHSRSELLARMKEETLAFVNAGGQD